MIRINHLRWVCIGVVAVLGGMASIPGAQEIKKQPADEVKALIDRLTELDRQDTGYSGSASGSAFLPLGQSQSHAMLLFQKPHESSDALRSLVKLGTKALPKLLEHLSDKRLTKIKLSHGGGLGGMFITEDEDPEKKKKDDDFGFGRREYTVMVGDLCYVAIGQIVNRNYAESGTSRRISSMSRRCRNPRNSART